MRIWFSIFLFFPLLVCGQSTDLAGEDTGNLSHYLDVYRKTQGSSASSEKVLAFVRKMEEKYPETDKNRDFVATLFNKTHQKFLRHYEEYAGFGETLDRGTYNCLTGTALYALLLDHFEIPYQIIETNYHIFLMAQTSQGDVLLETTDPANGFVTDPKEIESRIALHRQNSLQKPGSSKSYYRYSIDVFREINLDQMGGLLYYNQAIVAYNRHDLQASIEQLDKAVTYYPSSRTDEFSKVILLTVLESNLETSVRELCLASIQSLRKRQLVVTARTN